MRNWNKEYIATLACENKSKTAKPKSLKQSDFELIKTTANDKYTPEFTRTVVEGLPVNYLNTRKLKVCSKEEN